MAKTLHEFLQGGFQASPQRSREEIDRDLEEERASWDERDEYLGLIRPDFPSATLPKAGEASPGVGMHNEFTAVIECDGDWFISYSPEIPGANGQGRNREECLNSLAAAISLVLEDRREDGLRGVPEEAERGIVVIG